MVIGLLTQVASATMPTLSDLRLDLVESGKQPVLARGLRDEDARRPGYRRRLHDVSDPQDELVDPPVDTGIGDHFVELDLSCGKVCLGAGLLRRQNRRKARFRRLLGSRRGIDGSLPCRHERLELFDLARGNDVGIALLQGRLGPQFILRLLRGRPLPPEACPRWSGCRPWPLSSQLLLRRSWRERS